MTAWQGSRVLVTGASGFIGGHLLRELRLAGALPRALLRREHPDASLYPGIIGDLRNEDSLRRACEGIDWVIHAAGYAHAQHPDAGCHHTINAEGTIRLLQIARQSGVQGFIFLSSVKAMGEPGERWVDEDFPAIPETPYGQAKRAAEEALHAAASPTFHTTGLRLSLVYGPKQRGNLAQLIRWVQRVGCLPLPAVGNCRSMVHVQDVGQAVLLARQPQANGRIYLVTDGKCYATHHIIDGIQTALGARPCRWRLPLPFWQGLAAVGDGWQGITNRSAPFTSNTLNSLLGSACYRNERICQELGFRPTIDLLSALPTLLAKR